MNINRVGKVKRDQDSNVYVTLLKDNYELKLPVGYIVTQDKSGEYLSVLNPGKRFTVLRDRFNHDVAYVFDGRMYVLDFYVDAADLVRSMPIFDRIVFKHMLYREVARHGDIPSIFAYKNLQKIMIGRSQHRGK